ncbi:hypothetical protein GW17_00018637 [Ensete ventricosum]|nr:hypothetical protein GW17_00018637 [Ensete ventricosum]
MSTMTHTQSAETHSIGKAVKKAELVRFCAIRCSLELHLFHFSVHHHARKKRAKKVKAAAAAAATACFSTATRTIFLRRWSDLPGFLLRKQKRPPSPPSSTFSITLLLSLKEDADEQ